MCLCLKLFLLGCHLRIKLPYMLYMLSLLPVLCCLGQPSCTVPLKSSSLPKPKVPVESRSVIQEPSIRDNAAALSCPNCFCLNSGDHKICLFCKKPLPIKTQRESSNLSGPSGHGQNVETRNLPPPALQSSQQQMQMQGNASTMTSSGAGLYKHCTLQAEINVVK